SPCRRITRDRAAQRHRAKAQGVPGCAGRIGRSGEGYRRGARVRRAGAAGGSLLSLILVCLVAFVAGVIQRVTGLAFVLVLIGPIVLLYGPIEGVTLAVL